jgi:hypothetical protein
MQLRALNLTDSAPTFLLPALAVLDSGEPLFPSLHTPYLDSTWTFESTDTVVGFVEIALFRKCASAQVSVSRACECAMSETTMWPR